MDSEARTRLERWYQDVGPGLLAYLRRIAGDQHMAEELLHETFVQATRHVERLSAAVSARAWLYGTARNLAATDRRRRRTIAALPVDVAATKRVEDPRLEHMRQTIADLPPALRETLALRLSDELSYEEIAAVLGIPVGTVRSRLHHALRRLRAALAPKEPVDEV